MTNGVKQKRRNPHTILSCPATNPSSTMRTGVTQGIEKIPPRIPVSNAPICPLFIFMQMRNVGEIIQREGHANIHGT
jgi:hypothetical protein